MIDLSELKVLVAQVHAYGNLGDELETAPLFYKLKEWGVGTVDAALSPFTLRMCAAENVSTPHIKGKSFLSKSIVRTVYDKIPEHRYDLVIVAPGPNCGSETLEKALAGGNDIVLFGITFKSKRELELLSSNRSSIRGIVVREPYSERLLSQGLQPRGLISRLWARITAQHSILMSGDISFSSYPYLDQELIHSYRQHFIDVLPKHFSLVFPRAYENGEPFSHVYFQQAGDSESLELWTDQNSRLAHFEGDVVIATTDLPTDREMMRSSSAKFPNVQHISCERAEELLALVGVAQSVHTARYHPGVAALMLNVPLTVLPHSAEHNKMEGLKLLKKGLAEGLYKTNNDHAWSFLRNVLDKKAKGKQSRHR